MYLGEGGRSGVPMNLLVSRHVDVFYDILEGITIFVGFQTESKPCGSSGRPANSVRSALPNGSC